MNLQYSGEETIPATADTVWAFVKDPEKVGHMPARRGRSHRSRFDALRRRRPGGGGPGPGKVHAEVELVPDESSHRIDLKISGGGFGSAVDLTAGADVVDAGNGTALLKWSGQAVPRGPVAAVGGRVLDAQAKKLIEQAFANVRQQLSS